MIKIRNVKQIFIWIRRCCAIEKIFTSVIPIIREFDK